MVKVIHVATMKMVITVADILVAADAILSRKSQVRMLARHAAHITEVHLTMEHSLIHHMIEASHLNSFVEPV